MAWIKYDLLKDLVSFILIEIAVWGILFDDLYSKPLADEVMGASRAAKLLSVEFDELSTYLQQRAVGYGHNNAVSKALTKSHSKLSTEK